MGKKENDITAPENVVPETAEVVDKSLQMVEVKLFKDDGNYKDDVLVSVNGRNWQIKRGVVVKVPAYVAEVLRNSDAQDHNTAMLIEQTVAASEAREQEMKK